MSKRATRRQRPHNILPAGFDWRDGRPRWLPSPTRRRQGWKPCDLLLPAPRGERRWMTQGAAIERCTAINAAVRAWLDTGAPVPPDMAAFAPPGAVDGTAPTPDQKAAARTLGALVDEWTTSGRFTLPRGQGGLAPTTAADYRSKIGVLLLALVEGQADKLTALRALPIDTLAVPEEEEDAFPLEDAYNWLLLNRGHDMAYGVLTVTSVFITWCWTKKRIKALAANPVDLIDRTRPAGKIRVGTQAEIAALIASADATGWASIGDAVLLALDLGWSLKDLLALDWRRLQRRTDEDTGAQEWVVTRVARAKTAVASSDIPIMALGELALNRIIARNRDRKVTPTHVIVREASPRNRSGVWSNKAFNDAWNAVRDHAAETAPTLKTGDGIEGSEHNGPFDFMDTRDTFITLAHDAEMTPAEVCKRSLHKNSARVTAVWEKHYGTGGAAVGRSGARKMGGHMADTGWVQALGQAAVKAAGAGV